MRTIITADLKLPAQGPDDDPSSDGPYGSEHYSVLLTCFSLFVVLFLPDFGYDNAPVGEELMEWLNMHFIEPSTEEGDQLSSLDKPWEDDLFWPYLTRYFDLCISLVP